MNLFYNPEINTGRCELSPEESRHCIRVLRLKAGDIIHVTDGVGNLYKTQIIDSNPKKCGLEVVIIEKREKKKSYSLHIAVAPTKNISRFEWFLEKATEIGIDEITPVICENSERTNVKTDRLNKVIISAVKQSLKTFVPVLNEAIPYEKFITRQFKGNKFIAYCSDEYREQLKNFYQKEQDTTILIGPEGDFNQAEIKLAKDHSFLPVSLGDSRLRTETAALAACFTVNLANQ